MDLVIVQGYFQSPGQLVLEQFFLEQIVWLGLDRK